MPSFLDVDMFFRLFKAAGGGGGVKTLVDFIHEMEPQGMEAGITKKKKSSP